jgi:hypothetical protein
MSRMQEVSSHKNYDQAEPSLPLALERNAHEWCHQRHDDQALAESDRRRISRDSILWIVRNPAAKVERPAIDPRSRLKTPRTARRSAPKRQRRPEPGSEPVFREQSESSLPCPNEGESVAAQIRSFQERADLRECLLPGMLSRVSRKACEGWQKQATVRTSRVLAKMKRDSCKRCQYRLEPDSASA